MGGSIALASCTSGPEESSSSEASSASSSSSSSSSSTAKSVTEETMSYLKGSFYGGGGTLVSDVNALVYKGDIDLTLVPTSVSKLTLSALDEDENIVKQKVIAVNYDAASNNGVSYRLYADTLVDGLVHLEKEDGEDYSTVATFQPNVSKYAGTYSAFAPEDEYHGSEYNNYFILDPNFDVGRDVYPTSRYSPAYSYFSSEQGWYSIARIRLGIFNQRYYSIEFYDSDAYGYGELPIVNLETGYKLDAGDYDTYYLDEGAYQNLSLYDEASGESVSLSLSSEEKTLTFGEKSGSYQIGYDDLGMNLKVSFGEEEAKLRLLDHYLTYESGDKTTVYPYDSIDDMMGTFTDKVDTFSYDFDLDTYEYALKFNGETVETYAFVTENNRKSFSFDVDGTHYVVSPDKSEVAVRVKKGNDVSYYINEDRYGYLFVDSFVAHDKDNSFTLTVDSDFAYSLNGETGETSYSYSHGDRYPSLVLEGSANNKKLTPVFESAGYYVLESDNADDVTLYSGATLEKVYETYSSNGKDTLVLTEDKLTYDNKSYDYEFAPYYNDGTGYYYFAINSDFGYYISSLDGCLYNDEYSFIYKDIFSSIAGTYSLYGKYGVENIKMSEDGNLTLDTLNDEGTGLDKDVAYTYQIITTSDTKGNIIPIVGFDYVKANLTVLIYFYDDHVTIAGLDYYRYGFLESWGVYLDDTSENILHFNNGDIYLNGDALTITSMKESDGKVVYETSEGTISIDFAGATASAKLETSEGTTTSFTRKYDFDGYEKFAGEYEVNDTTLKFAKVSGNSITYKATIGEGAYATTVEIGKMKFVLKDGNVSLEISYYSSKYYLTMDESGTVSASYESTIPTPPPAPPLP